MIIDPNGGPAWLTKWKTASTTRASTTTPTADPTLVFPMLASKVYRYIFVVQFFVEDAAADFKYSFTLPSGATFLAAQRLSSAAATASIELVGAIPTDVVINQSSNNTGGFLQMSGTISNSTTPGNMSFLWSQNASSVSPTYVQTGSYVSWFQAN
jgi:hypothetical protein